MRPSYSCGLVWTLLSWLHAGALHEHRPSDSTGVLTNICMIEVWSISLSSALLSLSPTLSLSLSISTPSLYAANYYTRIL